MGHDTFVKSGWHWQFGLLRRKDQDCEHGYCYEEPDGDLIFSGRSDHKKIMFLDCYKDSDTGEKYLCFNKLPVSVQAQLENVKRTVKRRKRC
jgi:hypothetical protein